MTATDAYVDMGIPPVNTTNAMEVRDTLVIGCGGFGLLTAAHLRANLGRFVDVNDLKRIRFLGVDTAVSLEREKYLILKHFAEGDLLSIQASNELLNMIDHPASYPDVMESIPDIDQLSPRAKELLKESPGPGAGAGTQRLASRLFFRSEGRNISNLKEEIEKRFSGSGITAKNSMPPEVFEHKSDWTYIFIATSLYGGTGAGLFADVAAMCRKIAEDKNRTTFIIGVFYLPSFMDTNISPHHKAQAYAALKELDHFLSGNKLSWKYPEGTRVEVTNAGGKNKLFNLAFLVDTPPNADLLTGDSKEKRNQLASNGAELIFHLCATHVGENFYQRWVDLAAMEGKFIEDYPGMTFEHKRDRLVIEQRKTSFSAFRFKTVGIDQEGLRRYLMTRFAWELFKEFSLSSEKARDKAERIIRGAAGTPPLTDRLLLSVGGIEQQFAATRVPNAEAGPELEEYIIGIAQRIAGARERVGQIANGLAVQCFSRIQSEIVDVLKREGSEVAELVLGYLISYLQGDLATAVATRLENLQNQGFSSENLEQEISRLARECTQTAATVRAQQRRSVLQRGVAGTVRLLGISRSQIGRRQGELWINRMRPVALAANRIAGQPVEYEILLRMHELANDLLPKRLNKLRSDLTQPVRQRIKAVEDALKREEEKNHPRARWADSLTFTDVDRANSQFVDRVWKRLCDELPADARPAAVAEQLRETGLEVRTGERVTMERFVDEDASTIFSAVSRTARNKVAKLLDAWTVDFDDRSVFYYPSPPAPNDFQEICKRLNESKFPLLSYSVAGKQGLLSGVIANSMIDRAKTPNWLDLLGVQDAFHGPVPGLVTAYNFTLGFPLVALRDIKGWYLEYLREIHQGLPVHAIKSAVYMREPYFDSTFRPSQVECGLLFELATHEEIGQIGLQTDGGFVLGKVEDVPKLRSELRNLFWDTPHLRAKGLSESDFKAEMETNLVLSSTVRERVFNTALMKILDETGRYHSFRWREFLKEILDKHRTSSGIVPDVQDFFSRLDESIRKAVSE